MNKTDAATQALILRCLTDGMSVRATARVSGTSKGTVLRLLVEAGEFAAFFQDQMLVNLPCRRVEADEIWSFVGAKQKNARIEGQGDLWTFCAIDAETKLVCSWLVGSRTEESTYAFIRDLAGRMQHRIQLSVDGWGAYVGAVRKAFAFGRVDLAQIVKDLGQSYERGPSRRYSPPVVTRIQKIRVIGRPDMDLANTSYVERLNLATRQVCKRFARLTSAHSRKAENHSHAVALSFFSHNFVKPHGTLTKAAGRQTTPAMAAGLLERVVTLEEFVTMLDPKAVTIK